MTKKKDPDEKKLIDEAIELEAHGWEPVTPPDLPVVKPQFKMPVDEAEGRSVTFSPEAMQRLPAAKPAVALVAVVERVRLNRVRKEPDDPSMSEGDRSMRRHG